MNTKTVAVFLSAWMTGLLTLILYSSAVSADAAPSLQEYNIKPGALSQTLRQIASRGKRNLIADPKLLKGLKNSPVKGRFIIEEAISKALTGTGLALQLSKSGALKIIPSQQLQSTPMMIAPVSVVAGMNRPKGKGQKYQQASSVENLTEGDIQRFRGSSASDFVSGIPGVLTGESRNSGALDINIRGMQGFGRVPVVIDGTRQQNVVYRGYAGVASRNYIDPDLIASVSINKGPDAGRYGVDATGGTAIMRTLSADDIILDGKDFGIRLKGSFYGNTTSVPDLYTKGGIQGANAPVPSGSDPLEFVNDDRPSWYKMTDRSESLALAKRWENLELFGAYAKRRHGNFYTGSRGSGIPSYKPFSPCGPSAPSCPVVFYQVEGLNRFVANEEVLNTSQYNKSKMLKAKYHLTDDQSLEISGIRYESDFGEMMPSQIIRFAGAHQSAISNIVQDTYRVNYDYDPESRWLDLNVNLWRVRTDSHLETAYDFGSYRIRRPSNEQLKRFGIDIDNASQIQLGDDRNLQLDYGLSYSREAIHPLSSPPESTTLPDPTRPPGPDNIPVTIQSDDENRDGWRKQISWFVNSKWEMTKWLQLDAGLRYTNTESYDNKISETVSGSPPNQVRAKGNNRQKSVAYSPSLTLTLEPVNGLQFYTRYAEAVRAPGLFESTKGWSFTPRVDVKLKPERSKNWETGLNFAMQELAFDDDKLQFKVNYFENLVDDYLTRGFGIVNLDEASFKGWEISSNYSNSWLDISTGAIFYKSIRFCTKPVSGNNRDNCSADGTESGYEQLHIPPKKSAFFQIGTRLMQNRLHLGSRTRYEGKRYIELNIPGASSVALNWGSYSITDLYADYKFNENFQINMGVDNVRDKYYMDALTLAMHGSPGRTLRLGLTINY